MMNNTENQNPLEFFEAFFSPLRFILFREKFYDVQDELAFNLKIDRENELYQYDSYDYENKKFNTVTETFSWFLQITLLLENGKFRKFIDNKVNETTNEGELQLFFKTTIYRIRYVYQQIKENNQDALKYESTEKLFTFLIKYIFEKYEPFVLDYKYEDFFKDRILKIILHDEILIDTNAKTITTRHGKSITSFKWIHESEYKFDKFRIELIKNEFIPKDISLDIFKKAFDGEVLKGPLKIKWLKKVNGKLSKPLIFFFIDMLMDYKFIERVIEDPELYKKIAAIFVDFDGKELKNMKVSNHTAKHAGKGTPQEKVLKAIIVSL